MSNRPEPRDPASILKKHFTTMQVDDGGRPPRYVMSERNRAKLARIEERVRQMRKL
jgi:hypothetical protein